VGEKKYFRLRDKATVYVAKDGTDVDGQALE